MFLTVRSNLVYVIITTFVRLRADFANCTYSNNTFISSEVNLDFHLRASMLIFRLIKAIHFYDEGIYEKSRLHFVMIMINFTVVFDYYYDGKSGFTSIVGSGNNISSFVNP